MGATSRATMRGRRIGLEHTVEIHRAWLTAEQIAAHFGDLDLEQAYAAITYYLHSRAEVDASLARLAASVAEQRRKAEANPSPVIERLRKLKQQREQDIEPGASHWANYRRPHPHLGGQRSGRVFRPRGLAPAVGARRISPPPQCSCRVYPCNSTSSVKFPDTRPSGTRTRVS